MIAYTDYPFVELGDEAGQPAPVRQVNVLSFDGNKLCCVEFEGKKFEIKWGYVFPNEELSGDPIDFNKLPIVVWPKNND